MPDFFKFDGNAYRAKYADKEQWPRELIEAKIYRKRRTIVRTKTGLTISLVLAIPTHGTTLISAAITMRLKYLATKKHKILEAELDKRGFDALPERTKDVVAGIAAAVIGAGIGFGVGEILVAAGSEIADSVAQQGLAHLGMNAAYHVPDAPGTDNMLGSGVTEGVSQAVNALAGGGHIATVMPSAIPFSDHAASFAVGEAVGVHLTEIGVAHAGAYVISEGIEGAMEEPRNKPPAYSDEEKCDESGEKDEKS